jgi:hypothetical protein
MFAQYAAISRLYRIWEYQWKESEDHMEPIIWDVGPKCPR